MSANTDRRAEFEREAVPRMDTLYGTALSMARGRSEADDLVQETYLKAWRFWDQYQSGTFCKAGLFTILTNTYINLYRKRLREPHKVDYDELADFGEKFFDKSLKEFSNSEAEVFDGLFGDEMQAAIETLPEYFRIVLLLAEVQGLSYQEIGASHRHRAIPPVSRPWAATSPFAGVRCTARDFPLLG